MQNSTRKIGEAKEHKEIFKETNTELLGNLMKGIHLDGGGKTTFYKDQASKILLAAGIPDNNKIENTAKILYEMDYERLTAVRKSMLKRSVLLGMRLRSNGNNIEFNLYVSNLIDAIRETKNHSRKLLEGISK
jgi:hypothetical protein